MVATSGLTLSTGDSTTGTWNTIITTWDSGTTGTVTFDSLAETVSPIWNSQTMTASNFTATNSVVWPHWINEIWMGPPHADLPPVESVRVTFQRPSPVAGLKQKILRIRKRRTAQKRGRALLRSIVSDDQWRDYLRWGAIREIGGRAMYEVGCGWMGHVYELGFDGEPQRKLCLQMGTGHTVHKWTKEDRVAAVLLALRNDEHGTIAKAGVHRWEEQEQHRVRARRGHLRRNRLVSETVDN